MKSIKNILNVAAMMTLGLASLSSCTDGNDWSTDSTLARLFGTKDISLDIYDTKVGVTFTKVKGAKEYQVEVSTDSLYLDEVSETSVVTTFTDTPDTLRNLQGETKYYLRMRCIADDATPSKWVYYNSSDGEYFFTTKSEQLFNALSSADIDESTVHVTWKANEKVTNIVVLKDQEEVQNVKLSAEQIAAGEYTVEGLSPLTNYTINLMNGKNKRGVLTVKTAAAMPKADLKVLLSSDVKAITQTLIDEIAEKAKAKTGNADNYSVTLGIPAGSKLAMDNGSTSVAIPDGMSITFFGLAGDAPTLTFTKQLEIGGNHSFIKFYHVNLVDDGAKYLVNQTEAATIDEVAFEEVDASGFATSFFRLQQDRGITIKALNLKGSIFHNMCSGYGFIHVDAKNGKGKINNINISNSTFYNIATGGKMFIYSKNTNMESIVIDHITMYNSIGNGNYLIDFGSTKYGADKFVISNSVFGKFADDVTGKDIRSKEAPAVSNTFTTSDCAKVIDGTTVLDAASDKVFKDAANGDFTLDAKYARNKAGDTRWLATE